jgi:hypothetical protein
MTSLFKKNNYHVRQTALRKIWNRGEYKGDDYLFGSVNLRKCYSLKMFYLDYVG